MSKKLDPNQTQQKKFKFLVGIDGSLSADKAFQYAISHTNPNDEIVVVTGIPTSVSVNEENENEEKETKDFNITSESRAQHLLNIYSQKCATSKVYNKFFSGFF
jgi:hypothetical protein